MESSAHHLEVGAVLGHHQQHRTFAGHPGHRYEAVLPADCARQNARHQDRQMRNQSSGRWPLGRSFLDKRRFHHLGL